MSRFALTLGANFNSGSTRFKVWAPEKKVLIIHGDKEIEMEPSNDGYLEKELADIMPGDTYKLKVNNGLLFPDPVSRFLPKGLEGGTEVIDQNDFKWEDNKWKGINPENLIIYELHVGTFSKDGTYKGSKDKIPYINYVGHTCMELMPVSEFNGKRGWGYDGVNLYAPFHPYGRPNDLKSLVNELHKHDIAAALDVQINHTGPGGEKYLDPFGPYLTDRFSTPWGKSFDYALPAVRDFVISNFIYWASEYHIDVFRIDASEYVLDDSAKHLMVEVKENLDELSKETRRKIIVIDEDFTNSLKNQEEFLHDAEWAFDPGHALIKAIEPNERTGWTIDFNGTSDLSGTLTDPHHVHNGLRHSQRRKRKGLEERFGKSAKDAYGAGFIISDQNHDIIGNRPGGDRQASRVKFDKLKISAAVKLLSRYIPMTFMGQEFGSTTPFHFFTDHTDQLFIDGTRSGRNEEYIREGFTTEEIGRGLDPNSEEAFILSKLNWDESKENMNKALLRWHEELIAFRKQHLIPEVFNEKNITVHSSPKDKWITIKYTLKDNKSLGIFLNLSEETVDLKIPFRENIITVEFNSNDKDYFGNKENTRGKNISNRIIMDPNSVIVGWIGKGQDVEDHSPTDDSTNHTPDFSETPSEIRNRNLVGAHNS